MHDHLAERSRAVLYRGTQDAVSEGAAGGRYTRLPWVDLICAGVPCQDVSVAGKRAGLKGERTGLFYEFARILRELRPTWFLFENVPGLLSSNGGRDFAEVQRVLMVECGYGICWRVLNSQFFGVAQRRRRLFVVGRFGKPCPAEILFELASGSGSASQSNQTWSDIANTLTEGTGRVGSKGCDDGANLSITFDSKSGGDFRPSISDKAHCTRQPRTAVLVLGRDANNGHSGFQHAGKRSDDARETAFSLRSDPGGIGQGHNTTFAITENMRNRSQGPANYVSAPSDANGVRDFAGLPEGMDSARYRALGNAVTVPTVRWIIERIKRCA